MPVNYPGHTNTVAQRILPDGAILGCYHDTDQMLTMYGMTTDRRRNNQLPVAVDGFSSLRENTTMINGGTPSGRKLTRWLTDMVANKARGFVFEGGELTPFDAPNSSWTQAWDMGPSGIIVGLFRDADAPKATHGFVRDGEQYTTINYPGSTYTDIFGTARDVDRVMAIFAPDAVVILANNPLATGPSAVRALTSGMVGTPGLSLNWVPTRIEVASPTVATAYGTYSLSYDGPQGKVNDTGNYTNWHQVDGQWRVALHAPVTSRPMP